MTMSRGSMNLGILGAAAIIFAVITTLISLKIYHDSGDIYLDRSRPGYLPDEDEAADQPEGNQNFTYSDSGDINVDELEEYLHELQLLNQRITNLSDPYGPSPLSNESLGIPTGDSQSQSD